MSARQIRALRSALRLSQQAFATRLNVGIATVGRWERGRSVPTPANEARIRLLSKRAARAA